ncbi:MAG: vWA domain-containing protein [Polyangiaceae bacterium]
MRRPPVPIAALRLYAALLALAVWAVPALARAEGTLRTVLVIDASSSMLSTDPKELRKVAAELFVDLARQGDEIAVTGFDGGARESTGGFIAIHSPEDRSKLKAAIRAVGKNGSWTDFTQGLAEAKRLLDSAKKEAGDQTFVVFLTDGRCDPDPKGPLGEAARAAKVGAEAFCKQRTLDTLVPSLAPARLFAVGLSRSAPRELLEEAARRTGGVALTTDKAEELPHIFADVYARLLGSTLVEGPGAESIPISVEEGALSLDVVVVGPRTVTARLFRPDGREVSTANAKPEIEYFSDTPQYRFFKVALPPVGQFQLKLAGGGRGANYAALQNLDLRLAFFELPEVLEIGEKVTFKVRLATPGGRVPAPSFLDRHQVAVAAAFKERCGDPWLSRATRAVPRGADNLWGFTISMQPTTRLCLVAELFPGPGGVLTRRSSMMEVRLIPPIHLKGAPVSLGKIKQGQSGKGAIDLTGSEIGTELTLSATLQGRPDLTLSPATLKVDPKGARSFEASLAVDRDAKPGPATVKLTLRPEEPRGFDSRVIEVDVTVDVVPLTFWERYGFWIKVGAGAALFLFILLGVALPRRFKRTLVLVYEDVRDPDLPREATYPLGVKAKAGFYRSARLLVAATGPVRRGGAVELSPAPGGGVVARPLSGQKILELPRKDTSGLASEPREMSLTRGQLRLSPGRATR